VEFIAAEGAKGAWGSAAAAPIELGVPCVELVPPNEAWDRRLRNFRLSVLAFKARQWECRVPVLQRRGGHRRLPVPPFGHRNRNIIDSRSRCSFGSAIVGTLLSTFGA